MISNKSLLLLVVRNIILNVVILLVVIMYCIENFVSRYLPISCKIVFGNRCQSHHYLHNVMKLKIYFDRV